MEKRKLGDQWVEEIEGKMHMLKVVPIEKEKDCDCGGCHFYLHGGYCGYVTLHTPYGSDTLLDDCPVGGTSEYVIKDLGILNEDGCLPCPFCGEYPKIIYPTENMPVVSIVHTGGAHRVLLEFFINKQEAIDAWNWRV